MNRPVGYLGYRVMVLALDDEGGVVAIGPVVKEASVDRIREEIVARGWEPYGQPRVMSVADWRREIKGATSA